jgi:chemotaxis protein methyltransferase CheR
MSTEIQDLTRKDYEFIRRLVYDKSGINLGDQKMQLVRARLGKRVRKGGFKSFRDYFNHVERDLTGGELAQLLDAITTNTTHLFREMRHFTLLRKIITGWMEDRAWRRSYSTLRIWSAACSSGEEPHSIAMVAHEVLQRHSGVQLKILATDLSLQVLAKARLGLYDIHRVGTVPPEYRNRYLHKVRHEGQVTLQVAPEIRNVITFARFNLMTPSFGFKNGFDIVFCRNVMIYFDRGTQQTLVNKIAQHLHPGGYLMIGHSESLNAIQHPLTYVEPTVYRKD